MPPAPKKSDSDHSRDLGSPYGPQPHGDDEAAGGADSSPHETEPSGSRDKPAEGKGIPGSKASEPGNATG